MTQSLSFSQTVHSLADCLLSTLPTPSQLPAVRGFLYFCVHFIQTVLSTTGECYMFSNSLSLQYEWCIGNVDNSVEIGPKSLLTKVSIIIHYVCILLIVECMPVMIIAASLYTYKSWSHSRGEGN